MVENEFEYIEFLIGNGLQDNSAYSYGRYLEAISSHLEMPIAYGTVTSDEVVEDILERLSDTDLAQGYQSNCGTALRCYLRFVSETPPEYLAPDEITNPEQYFEGVRKTITVNAYERDINARRRCLEIHGYNCAVCEMNFEAVYGQVGLGYIHVHHKVPLSEIGTGYEVNPETGLVPICPNCHAMLHRPREGMTIEELRQAYHGENGI